MIGIARYSTGTVILVLLLLVVAAAASTWHVLEYSTAIGLTSAVPSSKLGAACPKP